MKKIKGYLIGSNLSNGFSNEIYTTIDPNVVYKNKQIKSEKDLASFLNKKDFDYLNITAPYKKIIREYLDQESNLVKVCGCCNLVVNEEGVLKGYNTDYYGFKKLLLNNNIICTNKKCLILGNGATSRTVEAALKELGAKSIEFGCRTKHIGLINEVYYNDVNKDAEIIINTTPLGKKITDKKLIDINEFESLESFVDVVYNPYRTPLMLDAISMSKGAINGYDMLLNQARLGYELATKKMYPSFMWNSLRKHLMLKHINVVLIGMPTCGKSMLGKELNRKLNVDGQISYIDTDKLSEDLMGTSIREAFQKTGEKGFRQVENKVVKMLENAESYVISTGGGTILDENNYRILASKGIIVYLKKTKFDDFVDDGSRPMIKSIEDLNNLYLKRNPIYNKRADITLPSDVKVDKLMEETINAITGN